MSEPKGFHADSADLKFRASNDIVKEHEKLWQMLAEAIKRNAPVSHLQVAEWAIRIAPKYFNQSSSKMHLDIFDLSSKCNDLAGRLMNFSEENEKLRKRVAMLELDNSSLLNERDRLKKHRDHLKTELDRRLKHAAKDD